MTTFKQGQPTREAVYNALLKYKAEHSGKSPTNRELQRITGRSSGAVNNALRQLVKQELITLEYGEARGIELVGEFVTYQAPEPVQIR